MVRCGTSWTTSSRSNSCDSFYNSGKPVGVRCHAPAVFHRVTYQGAPIVRGKRVTGFTNTEEEEVQLTRSFRSSLRTNSGRLGGLYEKKPNWESFAITDGRLITGQNPASSTAGAQALVQLLTEMKPTAATAA